MTQELIPTTGTHPLRTRGPGRALYAAAMATDLAALLLLGLVTTGLLRTPDPVQGGSVFLVIGLQLLARKLRSRAWWYVPLRDAGPVPVAADLVFWSAMAAVLITLATVEATGRAGSWAFGAWFVVGTAVLAAWLPSTDRPTPEPPSAWWTRTVPMLAAAAVTLALAVGDHQVGVGTAAVVAVGIGAGTVGVRLLAARRVRAAKPA
jgi:hypothetical protein